MRVLLTIHGFPPDDRFGAELYTYYIAKGLQRVGHLVHVLYRSHGDEFNVLDTSYDDIPCTAVQRRHIWTPAPLNRVISSHNLPNDDRVDAVFGRLLGTFRPDVVHVNHLAGLSSRLPQVARRAGVPVVFTLHDFLLFCARANMLEGGRRLCSGGDPAKCARCSLQTSSHWTDWYPDRRGWAARGKRVAKALLQRVLEEPKVTALFRDRAAVMADIVRSTDLFIAPSRFLRDRMIQHGVPPEKLVCCDYGMADELFTTPAARRPRDPGRLRFGFIGQIARHKGPDVLLEAFRGFRDADLILYGRDADNYLAPYCEVLAQDNVHFRGPLLDADKAAAFAELDALVVPSVWYENSPLVIHEAFQAGVPVVCSDIGGMAELVADGVNGVHFRAGDAADLRAKLTRLCENPSELLRMRQHIPRVKGMADHIPELVGFYERVRQSAGPAAAAVPSRGNSVSTID
jgi:glycosyltransferase involved in cell wall biosynthesis